MEPSSKPDPNHPTPVQPDPPDPTSTGSQVNPQPKPSPSPSKRGILFNRPPAPAKPPKKGTIFQLEVVFLSAAILATLFTAWTPGRMHGFFAIPTQANLEQALQPTQTFVPGQATPTLKNPRLVGIVAGHWKNDSGAVCGDGLKEVDLNLKIASHVQKILADAGYQVELLHEFDPRLDGYQAAALISIHNDSCDFVNNEATGYKVASAFATRHPERPARLTACLRARYGAATGLPLHSTSVTPDMSSYHAFNEIDETTPAAIIETGFMNLDRALLTQQTDKVSQGVADGILCYMRNESIIPTPDSPPTPAATPTNP